MIETTTHPKVTKAVIAAAGFGTRFLPQTKAMPKEMLPLVDKPIIQYIVEQLVEAGIKDIIIVSNYSKRSIEDHFDAPSAELIAALTGPKEPLLNDLRQIADMANFVYVRQKEPLGNAAPLLYAGHLVNNEPFIYTWGDDFIVADPNPYKQMIDLHEQTGGSVFSCVPVVQDSDYDKYGIVAGDSVDDGVLKMTGIVEKPGKVNAPSELASVSNYLFGPEFVSYVERAAEQHDNVGELNIQTAMQSMIDDGFEYYALSVKNGKFYDTGNKLEYIKTVVDFALERDDIGADLRLYLEKRLAQ
ncbi:UTP--glucose-1-phosphate uridylyltransferase [Aeromicrobium sp.]|nr:UTP--glucose-1-phosphate uridylyltransferase [Candidatus Saccharibacteria bacterium]